MAVLDAEAELLTLKSRVVRLRQAIRIFRQNRQDGVPWPEAAGVRRRNNLLGSWPAIWARAYYWAKPMHVFSDPPIVVLLVLLQLASASTFKWTTIAPTRWRRS